MYPHLKPFSNSRVCTTVPYPCELCKGMCHRYGAWHESPTSPDSQVSTTGTSAAAWSVRSQHRPQHPDSALRALLLACRLDLKVYQHRAPWLCGSGGKAPVVRDRRNNLLATAPADSAETFTVRQRAARSDSVAGGGTSVHA